MNARSEAYARALRAMRGWAGVSQKELAKRAGYSAASVCAWEQGRKRPGLRSRRDVAEALGFSVVIMDNLAAGGLKRAALNLFDSIEEDPRITMREVATQAGVSLATIHNWTRQGRLKPERDGRFLWYGPADVDRGRELKRTAKARGNRARARA